MARFSRSTSRRPDEQGFVLIGVVMFVLALTILGLSLFGLSSYEGQFMNRSYDDGQALLLAQGGIERAKFVLAKKRDLTPVRTSLAEYPAGTFYACAWQDRQGTDDDSSGAVMFDTSVVIRVGAEVRGERRMVEVRYTPREQDNIYKRLMTVRTGVKVIETNQNSQPVCHQVWLTGVIAETVHDPRAVCTPGNPNQRTTFVSANCPFPDVSGFIGSHFASATPVGGNGGDFTLTVPGGGVGFFYTHTDPDAGDGGFSVFVKEGDNAAPKIRVHGTAIWMLDHGFRSNNMVEITGSGGTNNCLVLVSPGNKGDEVDQRYKGIWFFGGVRSTIPVILVSDRDVVIEHVNNFDGSQGHSELPYVSIFALHADMGGPETPQIIRISHDPDHALDQAGGLIDQLCDNGYLPNSSGLGVTFEGIAGTWRELDPDNPPVVN